jgi:hypothetical protein
MRPCGPWKLTRSAAPLLYDLMNDELLVYLGVDFFAYAKALAF